MLETIAFHEPPPGIDQRVLGVLESRCSGMLDWQFSVPAHPLLTLNAVFDGSLMHNGLQLANCFATAGHEQGRTYRITTGTTLMTLFCRADLLPPRSTDALRSMINRWVDPQQLFARWVKPERRDDCLSALFEAAVVSPLNRHQSPSECDASDDRLQTCVDALYQHWDVPLSAIASQLHMSDRTLQRLFRSRWGVSAKFVQRLFRLYRVSQSWDKQPVSLATLAANFGFADQAHLAREFRELAGQPPRALKYRVDRTHLPGRAADLQSDLLWALRAGHQWLTPRLLSDFSKTPA